MKSLWDQAFSLLLVTGALLGLTLPFGKLATARWRAADPVGVRHFVRGRRSASHCVAGTSPSLRIHRAEAALFRHRGGDFLCHPQFADVLGHPASWRRLHRHHVHAVARHHAGAVDPARRAPPQPVGRSRHCGRLRWRADGGRDARRGGPAGRAVLGDRRAADPGEPRMRQYLPHVRLAKRYRPDRACCRQPSRGSGHAAHRAAVAGRG